jgi:hypothetical protein
MWKAERDFHNFAKQNIMTSEYIYVLLLNSDRTVYPSSLKKFQESYDFLNESYRMGISVSGVGSILNVTS